MIERCFFLLLLFPLNVTGQAGTWTWMHGSSALVGQPVFGSQGIAAPANTPPGLYEPAEFTDQQGNFWIFGGSGSTTGYYADLWKFDPVTNQWAWMKGPGTTNAAGVYGVQGVPSMSNYPGARGFGAYSWTDNNGDLWLFGGGGYDINGTVGSLSDLWKYSISTNEWTWMAGPATCEAMGSYGTLQVPAPSNEPPSRAESAACWTTSDNELWLFGGSGIAGFADDMWRYSIATNEWTWMSGASSGTVAPNFGTRFVEAATNTPGGRWCYCRWTDQNDNLWLFTGALYGDVWKYSTTTNRWTWMGGSDVYNAPDSLTGSCVFSEKPPAPKFENRATWIDAFGRMVNYGGSDEFLMYDMVSNRFALLDRRPRSTGTLMVPSPSNYPGDSYGSVGFRDQQGNLWMFGGSPGSCNTLWKYVPDYFCMEDIPDTTRVCAGDSVRFSITQLIGQYAWDFGDPTTTNDVSTSAAPAWAYSTAGIYTASVTVSSANSSLPPATLSFVVEVTDYPDGFRFPNIFTPNGDGNNDMFPALPHAPSDYRLTIYDRWGNQVFATTDPLVNWDGTFSGQPCADGVYYWVLAGTGCFSKGHGFLHLMR